MNDFRFMLGAGVFTTISIFLLFDATLSVSPLPFSPQAHWAMLCASSALAGGFWVAAAAHMFPSRWSRDLPPRTDAVSRADRLNAMITPIAAIAILGAIVLLREPAIVTNRDRMLAVLMLILGSAALMALITLLTELAEGKGIEIESHWGGLGGSLGGWGLSSPVVTLLLVLSCLAGMVSILAPNPTALSGMPTALTAKAATATPTAPQTTSATGTELPASSASTTAVAPAISPVSVPSPVGKHK